MRSSKSKLALALALLCTVSGCADYLNRRDSITLGAGDAPAANSMIHTVNHFPSNASNTQTFVQP